MRFISSKGALLAAPIAIAAVLALAVGSAQAGKPAQPYMLVDPGTLGGPQSYIDLPGIPITPQGALLGTADTTVPNAFVPNFNPFVVGFPDPVTAHAFSFRNGHMTDLGALPGNNSSAAFQVNGSGVGAGLSENGAVDPITGWPEMHAVVFKNGKVADLGTLPGGHQSLAFAIDDRGQVAGFGSNGTPDPYAAAFFDAPEWSTQVRSFVWQNGVMTDIGTLGGPDAVAGSMNVHGQVMGNSYTDSAPNDTTGFPTLHPFLWEKGRMRDLGTLGGTIGIANWMNESGQVVGFSTVDGDATGDATLWNGKRLLDLGTLGGDFSFGNYVNDAGHVTGLSALPDGTAHAFLWANGKMRDLPPLPGAPCSNGFAINDSDDVVGVSDDCQGDTIAAVLWHKGVPYDLSMLVGPTNLRLDEPEFIDDKGEIVGHGFLPTGEQHLYRLVPNASASLASVAVSRAEQRRVPASRAVVRPTAVPTIRCGSVALSVAAFRCTSR